MNIVTVVFMGVVAVFSCAYAQDGGGVSSGSGNFATGANATSSTPAFKPQQPNYQNFAPDFSRQTNVYDAQGQPLGYAAPKIGGGENVFDEYGNPSGYISQTGSMYDEKGKFLGYTTSPSGMADWNVFNVTGGNTTSRNK